MKAYEIYDEENRLEIGTLLYYEKAKKYIIELREYLDEWNAPLLFVNSVKQGIFTVLTEMSSTWVRERIIPSSRQNISSILKHHKLKEYDENTFLELNEGRCSQDRMYIKKLNGLPEYVCKRASKNITECFVSAQNELICFFLDGTVKRILLEELLPDGDIEKIMKEPLLLKTVKVGIGGYSIVFYDTVEVSAGRLYEKGAVLPLKQEDFLSFLKNNIIDTSESCGMIGCSRQNLAYMIKEKSLKPVKENVKGNLFLKGTICKSIWD